MFGVGVGMGVGRHVLVGRWWWGGLWRGEVLTGAWFVGADDFDRFTMMVARKTRARVVNKELKAMKKK